MKPLRYLPHVATLQLDVPACIGCGLCVEVCPRGVLAVTERKARIVELDLCMECGACARNCPVAALSVKAGVGCAEAIIRGWLTGSEPNCGCADDGCC